MCGNVAIVWSIFLPCNFGYSGPVVNVSGEDEEVVAEAVDVFYQ